MDPIPSPAAPAGAMATPTPTPSPSPSPSPSPLAALPAPVCPLCGGANACEPARCGQLDAPCWCRDARFSADLLARVPEAQRGRACICAACVAAANRANPASPAHGVA
ncbi:MAG: cysteine-rich CWC family protein [Leptothrix sp. (in: b-proteobacteria)]